MQFGTAVNVHNDSERSDSRMYRNTRLHGVAPQKTAILTTPKLPPFTRVQTCPNHPLSLRHYALRHSTLQKYIRFAMIHFMHWVRHRHCK